MALVWKLVRISFWAAIGAFVLSSVAAWMEDRLGWSDDPRWIAVSLGGCLTFAGLAAGVVAKIVAAARKAPSRFPTRLMIATILVGFVLFAFQVITHLGPMGVV